METSLIGIDILYSGLGIMFALIGFGVFIYLFEKAMK